MPALAFKVAPHRNRWDLSHNGAPMATFATREEAERAALAIAARHPAGKTARIDLEGEDAPASTLLIF